MSFDTISATAPAIILGLSPLNWVVKNSTISSSGGGSSFHLVFTGTRRVELLVDTTALAGFVPSRHPVLAWTVNAGPGQVHQLTPGETRVPLTVDLADPRIDLYLRGFSPFEDRYTGDHPVNSVRITGFFVDPGTRTTPAAPLEKLWFNIGDSIMSGDAALAQAGQGRPSDDGWAVTNDARASYGYLLARHFGYAESRLAYGGYDYHTGLAALPALALLIDQITSTVSRLQGDTFPRQPDVILINLGENGVPPAASVIDALTRLRLRTGPATKIIVMIPASGKGRAEITATIDAHRASRPDPALFLVDLGPVAFETADGQHPTAAGHRTIYAAALPALTRILSP